MRLTIAKKLGIGFGILILLMMVTAAIAYVKVATMNRNVATVVDQAIPTIRACDRLNNGVTRSLAALRGYIILGDDSERARVFQEKRVQGWVDIDESLQDLNRLSDSWTDDADRRRVDQLSGVIEQLRDIQHRVESIAHTDQNIPAQQLLVRQAIPLAEQIIVALTALIDEEATLESNDDRKQLLKFLADSRGSFAHGLANIRGYVMSGDPLFRQSFDEKWEANELSHAELATMLTTMTPTQRKQWDRYTKLRGDFEPLPSQMFQLREATDWNVGNHLLAHEAAPLAERIEALLGNVTQIANRLQSDRTTELRSASDALRLTLTLATLVAAGIGIVVAGVLSRQILATIRKLAQRAQQISEGDLTGDQLMSNSADELGQLAKGFDVMLLSLRDLTGQILSVTENVNSATSQISSSAKQQACSTKEQATTVQEITSTMQELSQSGAQIVEKAKAVAAAAEATAAASKSGIEAVQRTNNSMQTIRDQVNEVAENIVAMSEKTQAIGDIIATVTDVAEQSNLLALNAAIEAAEAGQEGNRFSVVATEMKNLADQAKDCTVQVRNILNDIQKGINSAVMLTEEAVKRVEVGKQQADVSEQSIRQMSETTEHSVQAFQQIIAATNQQQVGFDQVTKGMRDIDRATQQTATGTSQLEQAVLNLSSLSQQLKTAVATYRI